MRRLSILLLGVSGLFCIIMLLNSCNRESLFSEDNDTETISENPLSMLTDEEFSALADYLSPTKVSGDEAMAYAEYAISLLEKAEPATKSVIRRPISAMPYLGVLNESQTKACEAPDTLAYIEERPYSTQTDTYHCNFGWDGYSDGWYDAGLIEVGVYDFDNNCYIVHCIES